jgi:hypothetical protein
VNVSSCVLAKPNQLLSIIICLFKTWLFLIKPEDLFDISGFGSAKAKHAVNIMDANTSLPFDPNVWGKSGPRQPFLNWLILLCNLTAGGFCSKMAPWVFSQLHTHKIPQYAESQHYRQLALHHANQ